MTNINIFNTPWIFWYSFQHALQFLTHAEIFNMLFQHSFQHILQFSICLEIFNMFSTHFEIFNIVLNIHYIIQHMMKFSTHFSDMFSTHFKHENLKHLQSNCNWTHPEVCVEHNINVKLPFVLKVWKIWKVEFWNSPVMNHVENCVENHVKNFKVCWKPCWKFQSVLKITVMWPLHYLFHQFWNIITVMKIKSDIINEDYRSLWCYMSSLIEILCSHRENWVCLLTTPAWCACDGKFVFQPCCELSLFSFKLSKFVRYF